MNAYECTPARNFIILNFQVLLGFFFLFLYLLGRKKKKLFSSSYRVKPRLQISVKKKLR